MSQKQDFSFKRIISFFCFVKQESVPRASDAPLRGAADVIDFKISTAVGVRDHAVPAIVAEDKVSTAGAAQELIHSVGTKETDKPSPCSSCSLYFFNKVIIG